MPKHDLEFMLAELNKARTALREAMSVIPQDFDAYGDEYALFHNLTGVDDVVSDEMEAVKSMIEEAS